MAQFVHPPTDDITLSGVLAALADPVRLKIFMSLMGHAGCMSCTEAAPGGGIAKSTLSHHFRILREAGLIRTIKRGVENRNVPRNEDIEARFPGLLATLLPLADQEFRRTG